MCTKTYYNESKENATDSLETSPQKDLSFEVQIVEGIESISGFNEHWDGLFARAVDAPPYLSRAWASTFIQEGYEAIHCLFLHGTEPGLWPCFLWQFENT